jgi:hypothetical protein
MICNCSNVRYRTTRSYDYSLKRVVATFKISSLLAPSFKNKDMKKIVLSAVMAFSLLMPMVAKADEGMWLLILLQKLNMRDMQSKGFKLTADEIYSLNKASIKDAIVMLNNGGCTAEAISDQGLLLTNHHCGYEAIQKNSTVDHDYLANGFWAKDLKSDLPAPNYTASFLVRIDDVTAKVNAELTAGMDEGARNKKIAEVMKKLEDEATAGTTYNAKVKGFFENYSFDSSFINDHP